MNARRTAMRTLTPAEAALVGGGFDYGDFLASSAAGAAVGLPAGALLLGPINPYYGAALGAFVGGFFGGAYYAGSELLAYCF